MEDKKTTVHAIVTKTASGNETLSCSYGDPPRQVEVRAAASVEFSYNTSTGAITNPGVARFSYSVVNAASHEGISATLTSDTISSNPENTIVTHHVGYAVEYRGSTVATSTIDVTCTA